MASQTNKAYASIPPAVRAQLPKARLRLSTLKNHSFSLSGPESGVVPAALDELERALHELDLTCEHSQELLDQRAIVEAQYERATRRYQALFTGAPEPYIMTDADGVILEVNTAASELLHVSPRWLRNKPLDLYFEERHVFVETLSRHIDSYAFGEPFELTVRPRERARVPVLARVKRFEGESGKPELWWVLRVKSRA
jgi:PAS domain S-box-containing protein